MTTDLGQADAHIIQFLHLYACLVYRHEFHIAKLECQSSQNHHLIYSAGPNTIVGLSKQPEGTSLDASKVVASLLPAYIDLLKQLKDLGVPEVQIHEPILTVHKADQLQLNFETTCAEFAKIGLAIDLVTYYDDIGTTFSWVTKLPVQV